MTDSGSRISAKDVDEFAGSRIEVTPAKSVLLLSRSSIVEVLKDGGSVVIGATTISLEITMLDATASVSELSMLVGSFD